LEKSVSPFPAKWGDEGKPTEGRYKRFERTRKGLGISFVKKGVEEGKAATFVGSTGSKDGSPIARVVLQQGAMGRI